MFADCDNFLELEFLSIRKVLSSNELNIDSELQVFNAADNWLCHDIIERRKNAKNLLSNVRFQLLSVPALEQIYERLLSNYHQCSIIIEAVSVKKQQSKSTSCKIETRYCNQSNFNIVVCGGRTFNIREGLSDVNLFYANNFNKVNNLPNMKEGRCIFEAVCNKGEIYVFGGIDGKKIEKYSPATNTWENVIDMVDDRKFFSLCSFMDNVYIFGGIKGHFIGGQETATCFTFNTKHLKWKGISRMDNERKNLACSVFEGRIVVNGGYFNGRLNTVEIYDHAVDTWENMPNMIAGRSCHKSVAVKNKLFVISGSDRKDCEVFDSTTKKFTLLTQPTPASKYYLNDHTEVIAIGSKIFMFQYNSKVITYDFENNKWSTKTCKATKHKDNFSILKYQ